MKEKLEQYFINHVLPTTTTAYKLNIDNINSHNINGTIKVACTVFADFLFTLPCCPDAEEHERLEDRFSFTLDNYGNVTECDLIRDKVASISL